MTVIIDYDAGNLRSVQRACAEVGLTARITNDARLVAHADRVIFPGVEWKMTPDPISHAMATEISVASSAKTPRVKALTSRNSESSSSGAD